MGPTIYPGLQFYCYALDCMDPQKGLCRTPSTYSYGSNLELSPVQNKLYVICADGSVQDAHNPDTPIGWELSESISGWYYRVTQVGFEPKRCLVSYRSRVENPPVGGKRVGTEVQVCFSQEAAVHESDDCGEPEVTSSISFSTV